MVKHLYIMIKTFSCLIILLEFREEFLTAEATDEVSLNGREVVKGR